MSDEIKPEDDLDAMFQAVEAAQQCYEGAIYSATIAYLSSPDAATPAPTQSDQPLALANVRFE